MSAPVAEGSPAQESTPSTEGAPAPQPPPLWRRALPFVTAAALLAFVLGRLNWPVFFEALSKIHYVYFMLFTLAFSASLLTTDSFATAHVYRTRICPVRFREVWLIRGASYLPSMLNHHVGQGWLTYFIAKTYAAPLWRVSGATLLVYATTFGCVYLLGTAALPFNHGRVPWLTPTILAIGAAGIGYLIVLRLGRELLKKKPITAPLAEAGIRGHLVALAYRLPHILVLFVGTWVPFLFFGIDIPFTDALAYIPVVMLVTALPITPQGIGTRDVIALELLSRYATGSADERASALAAATLSWAAAITLVQASLSPLLMRRARRMLVNASPAAPATRRSPK